MRLLIALAFLLTIASSCGHKLAATNTNHEIERVRFYARGCYGTCPHLILEADSLLNYKYYGEVHAERQGYFTGKMPRALWDSITTKLEQVNHKSLDTLYSNTQDDLATETIIWYNNTKKHIVAQSASLPRNVGEVWEWLMYTYRKVDLTPSEGGAEFFSNSGSR